MTDNGLAALAAALQHAETPVGATYPPIGPYIARAAAILGERGVFLPDGLPESVRDAASRLGIPATARYDDFPVDIMRPAPFFDDAEHLPPAKGTRHGPQCSEQAATIATLRAALDGLVFVLDFHNKTPTGMVRACDPACIACAALAAARSGQ